MPDDILKFIGRCHIEHGGVGHWLVDIEMTLRTNKKRTDFWYDSACGRQPATALHDRQRDALAHLKAWRETLEVLKALGLQSDLGIPVPEYAELARQRIKADAPLLV